MDYGYVSVRVIGGLSGELYLLFVLYYLVNVVNLVAGCICFEQQMPKILERKKSNHKKKRMNSGPK